MSKALSFKLVRWVPLIIWLGTMCSLMGTQQTIVFICESLLILNKNPISLELGLRLIREQTNRVWQDKENSTPLASIDSLIQQAHGTSNNK